MLKRLTILSLVFVSFLLMNHFSPVSEASPYVYKTSQTVSNVSYSNEDKVFYIYTQKDSKGRFWVVSIDPAGKNLKQLKAATIGHTIDITYVLDEAADDEEEIVKTVFH